MRVGYEVDKLKLYNFMKENDITQKDLSAKLGKSSAYISQIMGGKMNVSEEMLEKLADIMGVDENEIIATPKSPYLNELPGRRKRTVDDVVEETAGTAEEETPRPTFEERMEDMIMTDEERRNKFFSTQAFIDEMKKRECVKCQMAIESTKSNNAVDERLNAKIESLTNFLSKAIVNGRKYIGTVDLVNILVEQE